jgi:hypothetical protein
MFDLRVLDKAGCHLRVIVKSSRVAISDQVREVE